MFKGLLNWFNSLLQNVFGEDVYVDAFSIYKYDSKTGLELFATYYVNKFEHDVKYVYTYDKDLKGEVVEYIDLDEALRETIAGSKITLTKGKLWDELGLTIPKLRNKYKLFIKHVK